MDGRISSACEWTRFSCRTGSEWTEQNLLVASWLTSRETASCAGFTSTTVCRTLLWYRSVLWPATKQTKHWVFLLLSNTKQPIRQPAAGETSKWLPGRQSQYHFSSLYFSKLSTLHTKIKDVELSIFTLMFDPNRLVTLLRSPFQTNMNGLNDQ